MKNSSTLLALVILLVASLLTFASNDACIQRRRRIKSADCGTSLRRMDVGYHNSNNSRSSWSSANIYDGFSPAPKKKEAGRKPKSRAHPPSPMHHQAGSRQ